MAATLATLGENDVHSNIQGLACMLHMTDHVHDWDACAVELVHSPLGRDAHGADKESSLLLNDDVNELIQSATSVILVGLSGITTDLWKQEIDTEWRILVYQVVLAPRTLR